MGQNAQLCRVVSSTYKKKKQLTQLKEREKWKVWKLLIFPPFSTVKKIISMFEISGYGGRNWTFRALWISDILTYSIFHYWWELCSGMYLSCLLYFQHTFHFATDAVLFFCFFYQSWSVPSQLESRSVPASWVEVNGPQKSGVASETRWKVWCVPLQLGSWIFQLCGQLPDRTSWIQDFGKLEEARVGNSVRLPRLSTVLW